MYNTIKYSIFFIVVMLLQILLFNNLKLSVYISPLVYISFILLLPLNTSQILVLVLGLITGVLMDLSMATVGVNTIATLFTAYIRIYLLELIIGKELVRDGGDLSKAKLGTGKLLRFIAFATTIHCIVFFSFETMQWDYYLHTIIRIILSSAITVLLVFVLSLVLNSKPSLRI